MGGDKTPPFPPNIVVWPSGKATDFDSVYREFKSHYHNQSQKCEIFNKSQIIIDFWVVLAI